MVFGVCLCGVYMCVCVLVMCVCACVLVECVCVLVACVRGVCVYVYVCVRFRSSLA